MTLPVLFQKVLMTVYLCNHTAGEKEYHNILRIFDTEFLTLVLVFLKGYWGPNVYMDASGC